MLNPLLGLNMNLCTIQGRTDLNLKFEIILRLISISVMIWCAFYSVEALCYAAVFSSFFGLIVSSVIITRICELRFSQIARDFFPYLIMAIVANIPAYIINHQTWAPYYRLASGLTLSAIIYFTFLWLIKDTTASELLSFAKSKYCNNNIKQPIS